MKDMANELTDDAFSDSPNVVAKDFTAEDLFILKAMFLELEKAIDEIQLDKVDEGKTFPGCYIFELLEKAQVWILFFFFDSKLWIIYFFRKN